MTIAGEKAAKAVNRVMKLSGRQIACASKKASYTVEASFVVSICIWVLFALLYSGLYIHDQMVVSSVTNEMTASRFQNGRSKVTDGWKKKVKKKLEKSLFLMQIQEVKGSKALNTVTVKVRYSLPISLDLLKKIFSSGKGGTTFSTTRELVKPVEYKWDLNLLKEK
jgi:hypothetical protein